jgi:hypothetical protein
MELADAYEREQGREPANVSQGFAPSWASEALKARDPHVFLRHLDYISRDSTQQQFRFIEVKSRSTSGPVDINDRQRKAFESLGEEAWLYVVFDCRAAWDSQISDPYLVEIAEPRGLPWESQLSGWRIQSETVLAIGARVFSKLPSRLYPPRVS